MLGLFKAKNAFKQNVTKSSQPMSTTTQQNAELERQRKVVALQKTLEETRARVDTAYQQIDKRQALIKELIRNKKKAEAKRQLISLKQIQENVEKQENMCIILEKTKIQLEVTLDTSKMVDAFKDAADLQKEVEKNRDYLDDYLVDKREMDEQSTEIGKLLSDIAAGDQEETDEIDKMYSEFEQETLTEDIDKINLNPVQNVQRPRVESQRLEQSSRRDTRKVEESSIDDLLMESAGYN